MTMTTLIQNEQKRQKIMAPDAGTSGARLGALQGRLGWPLPARFSEL